MWAVLVQTVSGCLRADTYVKTYLMDGKKRIQKKRTKTIRASVDPFYITKLKYPAYNIHGRHLQVHRPSLRTLDTGCVD